VAMTPKRARRMTADVPGPANHQDIHAESRIARLDYASNRSCALAHIVRPESIRHSAEGSGSSTSDERSDAVSYNSGAQKMLMAVDGGGG
jgi:hypothetical protein